MPGRTGGERVTIKNLEIVKIEPEKNLLYIKGAVPGSRGSLLEIKSVK
jgi:large subunit ribosomal protein L3